MKKQKLQKCEINDTFHVMLVRRAIKNINVTFDKQKKKYSKFLE